MITPKYGMGCDLTIFTSNSGVSLILMILSGYILHPMMVLYDMAFRRWPDWSIRLESPIIDPDDFIRN